jgi:colanic acid biosynthesis glycosyl transferase WcaI
MKILIVAMNYGPERSGTAPYTTAWAEHLATRHEVVVLAGPPHYPEWQIHDGYGQWKSESVENGVRVVRLRHFVPSRTSPIHRIAHETSFAARVLTQRIERPDVVLAVSPPLFGARAAASLARRHRVPFGLVVQDLYSAGVRELGSGGNRAAEAIAAIERTVVGRADRVLTIHDRFAAALRERLGARAERVSVVENWAHVPEPARSREEKRAQLGWNDEHVALHAGNMGAKQGLETVVEAARMADAAGLPIRYVLLGDGNQRAALQRLGAGISRLQFLPPADQVGYAEMLNAADTLLVCEKPGVAEMSLPSKLTSYCAAGRPIVAATGSAGATAAALRASQAGVRVPAGDPAVLNAAVLELAGDPQRAARLGRLGREHARLHQGAARAMSAYDRWLEGLESRYATETNGPAPTSNRSALCDRCAAGAGLPGGKDECASCT